MKRFLFYLVMFSLGIALCVVAFRNQDWASLQSTLLLVDYRWAVPIFFITLLNHWVRARRWELLIQTLDYPVKTSRTFAAVLVSYLVSYAVPRMGEVARCGWVSERKPERLPALFGTVVVERSLDVLCLFLVGLLAVFLEYERLLNFMETYLLEPLKALPSVGVWVLFLLVVGGILVVLYRLTSFFKTLFERFWEGLRSILYLRQRGLFLLYTFLIWLGYFGMTYLWFFAFEESQELPVSVGLTMVFIGGIARSLPIQGGGMGAYHFLFREGILLFGISGTVGAALAILIHGFQSLFYLFGGTLAWLYLSVIGTK